MDRGTVSERKKIRAAIFSGGATIDIRENPDGTWFVDLYDTIIEAGSAAELLREIAFILEES